ncbi:MAG: hypothetical protein QMC70_06580, partial [Bacteroidia bacterium]
MNKNIQKTVLLVLSSLFYFSVQAQVKVGDNPTTIDARSVLELETDSQALYLPRLTTTQRDAQTGWKAGMFVYNTVDSCTQIYDGVSWACLSGPSSEPWYNAATNTGADSNTQNIYQMGNVGIGTNNTSRGQLTVEGLQSWFVNPSGTQTFLGIGKSTGVDDYGLLRWNDPLNVFEISHQKSGFGASGGQIYLAGNHNVGIGTPTPSSKLHVFGSGSVSAFIQGNPGLPTNANIAVTATGANRSASLRLQSRYIYENTSIPGNLFFGKDLITSNAQMTITSVGNVGIGTTAPTSKLHVWAADNDGININGTGDAMLRLGSGGSDLYRIRTAGSNDFAIQDVDNSSRSIMFWDDANEQMEFAYGNVGIGTTNPAHSLQVGIVGANATTLLNTNNRTALILNTRWDTDATADYNLLAFSRGASPSSTTWDVGFALNSSAFSLRIKGATRNYVISTNSGEALRISPTGNVGIGGLAPTHKLDVVGTAGLSTGTSWTSTSDMRLKDGVKPY